MEMFWLLFIFLGTFCLLLHGMEHSEGILCILIMRQSPQRWLWAFCLGGPQNVTPPVLPQTSKKPCRARQKLTLATFLGSGCKTWSRIIPLLHLVHGSPHQNPEFKINNLIHLILLSPSLMSPSFKTPKTRQKVVERSLWDMLPKLKMPKERHSLLLNANVNLLLAFVTNCSVCQETGLRRTSSVFY